MKFTMKAALTCGTLDGANIEIPEEVGEENFFLFGMNAQEVRELRAAGYDPMDYILRSEQLRGAIDLIASGFFAPEDPSRFHPIANDLRANDTYLLCADFDDYVRSQKEVGRTYQDTEAWMDQVIENLARVGKFSSDRTISQYAEEIWQIAPVKVEIQP